MTSGSKSPTNASGSSLVSPPTKPFHYNLHTYAMPSTGTAFTGSSSSNGSSSSSYSGNSSSAYVDSMMISQYNANGAATGIGHSHGSSHNSIMNNNSNQSHRASTSTTSTTSTTTERFSHNVSYSGPNYGARDDSATSNGLTVSGAGAGAANGHRGSTADNATAASYRGNTSKRNPANAHHQSSSSIGGGAIISNNSSHSHISSLSHNNNQQQQYTSTSSSSSNAAPIRATEAQIHPYRTKPPSYLHTLLPHILPPLLSLYPNQPPKSQLALHLYALIGRLGDRRGFQKSEKDLMWYDVLCCIEEGSKRRREMKRTAAGSHARSAPPPAAAAGPHNHDFSVIWNAFNGDDDLLQRNQLFFQWATEYMQNYQYMKQNGLSINQLAKVLSERNSSDTVLQKQKSVSFSLDHEKNAEEDQQSQETVQQQAATTARSTPNNNNNRGAPTTPKLLQTANYDSVTNKTKAGSLKNSGSNRDSQTHASSSSTINSPLPKVEFPLDYAKQISDRVLQMKRARELVRARSAVETEQARSPRHFLERQSSASSYNTRISNLDSDDDENEEEYSLKQEQRSLRQEQYSLKQEQYPNGTFTRNDGYSADAYSAVPAKQTKQEENQLQQHNDIDTDLKSRRKVNVAPLALVSATGIGGTTPYDPKDLNAPPQAASTAHTTHAQSFHTSSPAAHHSRGVPNSGASTPLSSSSFVKLFSQHATSSPSSARALSRSNSQNSLQREIPNTDQEMESSSPEKSLILESYLKASGDDILETASSFIDKFYDDIVSPVSKNRGILSRKASSSSILSQRSRTRSRDAYTGTARTLDFGEESGSSTSSNGSKLKQQTTANNHNETRTQEGSPSSMERSVLSHDNTEVVQPEYQRVPNNGHDVGTIQEIVPSSQQSSPSEELAITPTNTALSEALSPLPEDSSPPYDDDGVKTNDSSPQDDELSVGKENVETQNFHSKGQNSADVSPKTSSDYSPSTPPKTSAAYEHMVHEYWTNYKSIMKTAKWKAEVIDLIAETRAEYELEKRRASMEPGR